MTFCNQAAQEPAGVHVGSHHGSVLLLRRLGGASPEPLPKQPPLEPPEGPTGRSPRVGTTCSAADIAKDLPVPVMVILDIKNPESGRCVVCLNIPLLSPPCNKPVMFVLPDADCFLLVPWRHMCEQVHTSATIGDVWGHVAIQASPFDKGTPLHHRH